MHTKFKVLVVLRCCAVSLLLVFNVLLARNFSLAEIGQYYLVVAIAYILNAAFFVGSDLNLQRQIKNIGVNRKICVSNLSTYFFQTGALAAALGGGVILAVWYYLNNGNFILMSVLCFLIAIANYSLMLARNIFQLSLMPVISNLIVIFDGVFKLAAIVVVSYYSGNINFILGVPAIGALLISASALLYLSKVFGNSSDDIGLTLNDYKTHVMPIGVSGISNWVQLQSYRPIVANINSNIGAVGSLSLLITLGSAATNAFLAVLGQLWIPRQYLTNGQDTYAYIRWIVIVTIVLCVLSMPAGYVFIVLSNKTELYSLLYLLPVGVFLESCNSIIGACSNHLNVKGRSLRPIGSASITGAAVALVIIVVGLFSGGGVFIVVPIGMVVSQICVISGLFFLLNRGWHA